MRQHGAATESKRRTADLAEAFLSDMQQAAREMQGALSLSDYKPVRGFAPQEKR